MEPRIQYAKTADGVNIAYWTLGKGMPLVHMPLNLGHIQMEWEFPECRDWYERLAKDRMLVRYDHRAQGLSDRENTDYSIEALVLELEALADRLGLERLALLGLGITGPAAVAFAARHPERVSHLILWGTYAKAQEWTASPQVQASRALIDEDWTTYTEAMANILLGWSQGEPARRFAELMRAAITPDALRAGLRATLDWDVSELLPAVRSPTLVIHRRHFPIGLDAAKHLSSAIPDARLALLDGESLAPYLGDTEAVHQAIDEFLGEGKEAEQRTDLPEGMAVILFADIVESTSLTEKLGDAAFRAKARELDEALRAIIHECSGTPVEGKLVGDGVLAVFTSARQAIECALRCNGAGDSVGLQLHLGIHAGDVIREGNNVYGGAVNIAARIAGASAPGEVLVSDTVRGLARTSAGVTFDDRGEQELKGIEEPQRLFVVRGGADG